MIVVMEAQVDPAFAARALSVARDALQRSDRRRPHGQRQARFFQGRDDPAQLLYLGVWDSRQAYEAAFDRHEHTVVETLLAPSVTPRFFQSLSSFERVLVPIALAVCQLVEGPPSADAQIREYLRGLAQRRREVRPDVVLSMICEEVDAPGHFLVVTGWQSRADLAAVDARLGDEIRERLAAAGAAVRSFTSVTRFDSGPVG